MSKSKNSSVDRPLTANEKEELKKAMKRGSEDAKRIPKGTFVEYVSSNSSVTISKK
ncbi:hypothetical protein [Hahella chejuensis]|uniref:hypothetical protein n=1 Tax=Hahella TaxID=158481 RepID=UPI0013052117|nr:hypothetical protein [Hahella chejuensis]